MTRRRATIAAGLVAVLMLVAGVWQTAPVVHGQETISAKLGLTLSIFNRLLVGLRTIEIPFTADYTQLFASGTGANQGNALFQDDRTLAASASENLDFNASLTDDFGQSVTCTKLKTLLIKAASGNTNNVLVGGGSTTITTVFSDTSDKVIVRPGGVFMYTAPDSTGAALTAGSADVLTVANSAGSTSVTYDIVLICVE